MNIKEEINKVVENKVDIKEAKKRVELYLKEAIKIVKNTELSNMDVTLEGYTHYIVEVAKMIQREN